MPKTISTELAEHLAGETTSIATLWSITRQDGESFYFTDHDDDIEFGGNTYESSVGYNRTAVDNQVGLSVDNLDVQGFLDSSALTETELRAGLFDYATVRVSIVNWKDLTQGELKARKGHLGEIVYSDSGVFQTELRGLTQVYSQKLVNLYQPECRADLGDSKCKIPINPDEVQRSTAYAVGDYVKVNVDAGFQQYDVNITNAGFEEGDLTGWTTVTGTPAIKTSNGPFLPHEGSFFLEGATGAAEDFEVSQVVNLSSDILTALGNSDDIITEFTGYRGTSVGTVTDDPGRILVELLDVSDNVVATVLDTGVTGYEPVGEWQKVSGSVQTPSTAEKIRIRLIGDFTTGTFTNAAFDTLSARAYEAYKIDITNPGFDTGDLTGWTTVSGTPDVINDDPTLMSEANGYFLQGINGEDFEVSQVVDFDAGALSLIGAGGQFITFECWRADTDADTDAGRVVVELLDSSGNVVAEVLDTGVEEISPVDTWVQRLGSIEVPSNAEKMRIRLIGTFNQGSIVNTAFDSLEAFLSADTTGAVENREDSGDRIFKCITAGTTDALLPKYGSTIGAEITDGTAVFETEESWTKAAEVATVTDNRTFTVTFPNGADSREVDDWFKFGAVIWDTGDNAGTIMEVKGFTAATNEVELFLPMSFNVQVGDKLGIYAGCDKKISTCINKFNNVLNFRGEPYVPGQDEALNYASPGR